MNRPRGVESLETSSRQHRVKAAPVVGVDLASDELFSLETRHHVAEAGRAERDALRQLGHARSHAWGVEQRNQDIELADGNVVRVAERGVELTQNAAAHVQESLPRGDLVITKELRFAR